MTAPISVENVSVRFGTLTALEDICFTVEPGAFVALIGPNGAGKSTLLNVILGIQQPTSGRVRLFGAPPGDLLGADIGYVPQLKTLDRSFPARPVELVVTGLRGHWPWRISPGERAAALEALDQTGVAHVARRPLARLSGGELQRVYLARTLVRQPRLLVLDEPGAGMDVAGEADMYHVLEAYQRQTQATILMITHDWEGARIHANRVLLLNRRILAYGPPQDAAREENLLRVFGHTGHAHLSHEEGGHA